MQEYMDVTDPGMEKEDGSLLVTAIEQTETYQGTETRYAWISDVPGIKATNVMLPVTETGRKRHAIEDQFNSQKNNRVGIEHVFCAHATASKKVPTRYCKAFVGGAPPPRGADPELTVGQLRIPDT